MKKNKYKNDKKYTKDVVKQVVDTETGELIEETKQISTFSISNEPDFVKLYVHDVAAITGLKGGRDRILLAIISRMDYDGIVPAYKPYKQIIANELGITLNYLNKCYNEFYKAGILVRYARGIYMADPNLFARGSWNDIKELRLMISYNKDGTKSIKSNVSESSGITTTNLETNQSRQQMFDAAKENMKKDFSDDDKQTNIIDQIKEVQEGGDLKIEGF